MSATVNQSVDSTQPDLFGRIERERARPFLKWAGGKSRLLPELRRYVPKRGYARYIEPFLDGGAFFFDLAPESAILGDSNPELINCYEAVRDEPANVLGALSEFRVSERDYYCIRRWEPEKLTRTVRAERLIYPAIVKDPAERY
jgi:DNA adenine methylase